jgi:HD-GYP domain-containing protein (c-di-GMP phosphodiesterase class II)/HAMP domain-containing protein
MMPIDRTKLRRRLPTLTVRRRLLLAFLIVALLPLAVFAYMSFRSTSDALQRQARMEMGNRSEAMTATLRNEGRHGIDQVLSIGGSKPLVKAIAAADVLWIEKHVTAWMPEHTAFKGTQVLTLDGHIVSAGGQFAQAPSLFDLPIAEAAASTGASGWDIATVNDATYIVSAGQVMDTTAAAPSRRGIIVVGRPIDADLLADVARFTGAGQISLYSNGLVLASDGLLLASSAREVPSTLPSDVKIGTPFTVGSRTAVFTQLRDRAGGSQGVLRLAVDSASVAVTSATLRATGALALVTALIVALCVGLLMTTTIDRPLRRLTQAAAAMAGGDTRQHIDITSNDEIGKVADAFNTLSLHVSQEFERLSNKVKRMSLEIANLSAFGESLAQIPDIRGEMEKLTGMVADIFTADYVRLYLDEDFGLVEAAAHGEMGEARAAGELLAARAAATGEATSATPHLRGGNGHSRTPADGASLLAVPLSLRSRVTGVLVAGTLNGLVYREEDLALLATIGAQIAIALQNAEAYTKLDTTYFQTVTALAAAMEAKDHYTAEHADTLATMTTAVGRRTGLSESEQRQLQYAAVLHDIGKIGIPGTILNKPGRLTDAEFAVMAEHTLIGERIISRIEYLRPIARLVRSAHERWDGLGYPDGLEAEDIPLGSRILLACDAYHAMTSDRPYRRALPPGQALEELRHNAGAQFDPDVVKAFLDEYVAADWDTVPVI